MANALPAIAALLLGVILLQIASGLFSTFISLRMDLMAFSELAIGLVGSCYFGGFVLGTLYVERLVPQVGHIRAFAALAAVMCASTLLHALFINVPSWAALRFLMGFSVSGLFVIAESWINGRATNRTRGQIFSVYMIANYVALGGGQFLVGTGPLDSGYHFIIAAILFSFCLIPVALTRSETPQQGARHRFGLAKLYAISPMGVVGCLGIGMISGAFYALAPVFAQRLGLDTGEVATFMGSAILCALVLQWPLGKLSDLFDRRTILIIVAFLTAGLAAAIAVWSGAPAWLLFVLAGLFGGAAFTIYPLSVAHANDHIEADDLVPASAGLLLSYGLGAAVGPVSASWVMGITGTPGLFHYIAAMAAALGLFGLYRMQVKAAPTAEQQGPFIPLPRTSPVVGELNPRLQPDPSQGELDFEEASSSGYSASTR